MGTRNKSLKICDGVYCDGVYCDGVYCEMVMVCIVMGYIVMVCIVMGYITGTVENQSPFKQWLTQAMGSAW